MFSPRVSDCVAGLYSATFSSGIINQAGVGGRRVEDVYSFVKQVRTWRRHVEVQHRESPLLSLSLQHRSLVGVVVQYSQSRLDNFTGLIYQDSLSHLYLNLTLAGASGTITGQVFTSSFTQSVQVHLPRSSLSSPVNTTRRVRLTGLDCDNGLVTVSLRPLGQPDRSLTRELPCVAENLRMWRSVINSSVPVAGVVDTSCLHCQAAWLYWLDPSHWLDTGWSTVRALALVITLIVPIIALVILCKICKLCCKCCE